MEINHFFHHHPLKFYELMHGYYLRCYVCGEDISDEAYSCNDCTFLLHKSCAELPREIQHFFHPCLLFLHRPGHTFCNACGKPLLHCVYKCERCNFNMDVECGARNLNPPTINSADGHIQHFSHWHPLTLVPEMEAQKECPVCQNFCSGPTYGCSKCEFYIHKNCMDILPRMVQHLFHPCPLILIPSFDFRMRCNLSKFFCGLCEFNLDVKCALLPTIKTDHYKKIRANWHEHPLTLFDKVVTSTSCRACKEECLGPIYGCNTCSFFLHKYCYELPQQIQGRFDLKHPLSLTNLGSPKFNRRPCNLCFSDCNGIAFSCSRCATQLHIECASLAPTIKYQGHSHFLYFVEIVQGKPRCNSCGSSILKSPAFRCVDCNFSLHLLCGPLPITIKHKSHVDPLKLMNFYVDDYDEDDFYCDACENRRDPRQPVYYCPQGCPFVSEVECVISEVIASLKGERGKVKLRSVLGLFQDDKANGLVVDDVDHGYDAREEKLDAEFCRFKPSQFRLNGSENEEVKHLREVVERKMESGRATSHQDKQEEKEYAPGSEQDFEQFQNSIDSRSRRNCLRFYYDELQRYFTGKPSDSFWILNIDLRSAYGSRNEFNFPHILLPIYEGLLIKYRDVAEESKLSPNVKVFFFMILCEVILSMNKTVIEDISEDRLAEWMGLLKLVECGGFKLDFIWNHLQRVTRAYFGLRAERLVLDTLAEQEEEIARITSKIAKITRKVDELAKTLEAKKREHEDYKVFVNSVITNSYMKQCLDEASTIKWKPTSGDLFN